MQGCLPRSYLTPARDEEAESQRKAKSRHARQTRRSTQGVTLTELKEAQRTCNPSSLDRRTEEESRLADQPCLRKRSHEGSRAEFQSSLAQSSWRPEEITSMWGREVDELGNVGPHSGTQALSTSIPSPPSPSESGNPPQPSNLTSYTFKVGEWQDENKNPAEEPVNLVLDRKEQDQGSFRVAYKSTIEHERVSRLDSTGAEATTDRPLGRTSSYTRRENRLASLSKQEEDLSPRDYKKMYEDALHENEKLKSRLQDSKQELVKIRAQLGKVTQKQDRISERSSVLQSEKREKQVLEKRVTDMEEELKVLTELKSDNQRLKDENGALIRVISKLSK